MKEPQHKGPELGGGIYTLPDIGHILGKPYHNVHRWINDYWDLRLANDPKSTYSWTDGKSRAVDFHTLVELVVFAQLRDAGVRPKQILDAHKELSTEFATPYPFATSKVIESICTDGKRVYFKRNSEEIYSLDGKKQFNMKFIVEFFKNIDFGDNDLASKYWPMGRESSVVVDPHHQLGQPVIDGTNITPETLNNLHKAGEKVEFIAYLYQLESSKVNDAILFCKKAA